MKKKILVVDDDPTCNEFLTCILEDEGFIVRAARSADEAFSAATEFQPDVLIADWWLKDGLDGAEVACELKKRFPTLEVIFATGSPAEQLSNRLGSSSEATIIEKPIDVDMLILKLHAPLAKSCG